MKNLDLSTFEALPPSRRRLLTISLSPSQEKRLRELFDSARSLNPRLTFSQFIRNALKDYFNG